MILGHARLPRQPLLNLYSPVSLLKESGSRDQMGRGNQAGDGGSAGAGVDLGALGPERAMRTTSLGMRPQTLGCRNPILSGFILLFLSLFPSRAHHMHHSFSSGPQEEVPEEVFHPSREILGDQNVSQSQSLSIYGWHCGKGPAYGRTGPGYESLPSHRAPSESPEGLSRTRLLGFNQYSVGVGPGNMYKGPGNMYKLSKGLYEANHCPSASHA